MKAILALEDGTIFEGISIGEGGERFGEVVLNTSVVGYQEFMTDPANAGKILVLTYPLIGNYGIAKKFNESKKCWLSGLVIAEESRIRSNWQSERSLGEFLKDERISALSNIDTRTIALEIRDKGEMFAMISTKSTNRSELVSKIKSYKISAKKNYISEISVKKPTQITTGLSGPDVAIIDIGMTNGFIKQLKTLGCNLTLLPYDTNAAAILAMKPDGVIVSNGPEDDDAINKISNTVKKILGKVPLFGISTGHQIIGLALGMKRKRMKSGHHGANYPVKGEKSFKGEITVQNHSYVLDEGSLKSGKHDVQISMRNVNDGTVEEIESRALKFIAVQYYPVSPGFDEVNGGFKRFIAMMPARKLAGRKNTHVGASEEVQYAKT
jgi:carbamoyl-phosphate synthase small subunit